MKIAVFHELNEGGARRAAREISRELKKHHTVDLYCLSDFVTSQEYKYFSHVFSYTFDFKAWKGNDWRARIYKDTVELYRLRTLHKRIGEEIDARAYDAVIIHPSTITQAPFLLSLTKSFTLYYCQEPLRTVYEENLTNVTSIKMTRRIYDRLILAVRKRIDRSNLYAAKQVLVNSSFSKRNIFQAYDVNSKIVYLGVDTNFFKPLKVQKNTDVLFLGSHDYVDGYDMLQRVRMLASGIRFTALKSFKGDLNDQKLRLRFNQVKIVLCLAKNEPFGLIPLEAMACGVPVIALNEGGYKESVQNDLTGFLVDNNEKKIINKIEQLLKDSSLYKKMSSNARKDMLLNWRWEQTSKKIEKIIRRR